MLKIEYLKILIFVLVALPFVIFLIFVSSLLIKDMNMSNKRKPVECGGQTFGSGKNRIEINFFIVALIFIIFEIEVTVIIP